MKKGRCKHFTGIADACCAAGINYEAIGTANGEKYALELPCFTSRHTKRPKAQCDQYTEPTAEEIAAYDAETEALMARFNKVLPVIAKVKAEHEGESWSGVEVCPVCGGKLHMSHAACNGHVWGHCETKDCLQWME